MSDQQMIPGVWCWGAKFSDDLTERTNDALSAVVEQGGRVVSFRTETVQKADTGGFWFVSHVAYEAPRLIEWDGAGRIVRAELGAGS